MRFLGQMKRGGQLTLGYQVTLIEDPDALIEAAAEMLEDPGVIGARKPTSWMSRISGRQTPRVGTHDLAQLPTIDGRPCCAEALLAFDGRRDLQPPFSVTCPRCKRKFRVTLAPRMA